MLRNFLLDHFLTVAEVKKHQTFARRHGRCHWNALHFKHAFHHLLLAFIQHARFCASIHHGINVVRGDLIITLGRYTESAKQQVRQSIEEPNKRF
ncbi:Uncharacterised protein [Vibrio cholerae]|nr:Uncharacterised protein [Vibrio cholerae]